VYTEGSTAEEDAMTLASDDVKLCRWCRETKPVSDFGVSRGSVRSQCMQCRAQLERERNAIGRIHRTCSVCGGPLHGSAKLDVCRRNPGCLRINTSLNSFKKTRRKKEYRPCASCGGDWMRANRSERLCRSCQNTMFWCSGMSEGHGHVADRRAFVQIATCRACRLLRLALRRVASKGVPFDLTWKDVESIWNDYCPYLGIPIKNGTSKLLRTSPTLDRIIPALGYVPGNVEVISHQANSMKGEATPGQLVIFAQVILARHGRSIP
jgi:hypothetical protein